MFFVKCWLLKLSFNNVDEQHPYKSDATLLSDKNGLKRMMLATWYTEPMKNVIAPPIDLPTNIMFFSSTPCSRRNSITLRES